MAATNFPLSLTNLANLKAATGEIPRYNFKNDGTYFFNSGITTASGPFVVQGYSSSPGDGGRATFDASGANILPITTGTLNTIGDIILQNNGTGTNDGFTIGQSNLVFRCIVNNMQGCGIKASNTFSTFVECEAYLCNKSNTAGNGGIVTAAASCLFYNCISHDNAGANSDGFGVSTSASDAHFQNCISDTNGRHGFALGPNAATNIRILQCDAYNNGGDGIKNTTTITNTQLLARNCNFIKNVGWGINSSITTGRWYGLIDNCGFGSGTQVNGNGTTNATDAIVISGSITYASGVTPWVDPANGDFRINLPAAINVGRGIFTQTQGSYGNANMIAYPDIGAVQHYDVQKGFTFGG